MDEYQVKTKEKTEDRQLGRNACEKLDKASTSQYCEKVDGGTGGDDRNEALAFNREDFLELTKSCFENALGFFLDWIPNIITLYYINSHATQEESSGFGLGLVWSNSIGQGIYYGLSSGFETLAAHAHGSKNYDLVGILYQRTLFISLILFFPVTFAMIYSEDILFLWSDNPEICRQAGIWCVYALPGLFFAAISYQFRASLNAQNIYNLQYQAVAGSAVLHLVMAYILIQLLGMKVAGGGLCYSCVQLMQLVTLYFLVKQKKEYQKCYIPYNKKCLEDILPYLKIVIPIGSMLTMEWMVYEAYSIIASNLSPAQYSAHIVLANFNTIYYQFPEGYAIATTTFVSNEMGSGQVRKAKQFAVYGMAIQSIHFLVTLIPILAFKDAVIHAFAVDQEVEDELSVVYIMFVISALLDATQVLISGLMRAIGKEHYSSVSFLFTYVGFGIIASYVLAYSFDYKLPGLWMGVIISQVLYNSLQLWEISKQNWSQLSNNVQDRVAFYGQTPEESTELTTLLINHP